METNRERLVIIDDAVIEIYMYTLKVKTLGS